MGRNGIFGNVGIPGSGLSYRTRIDEGNRAASSRPSPRPNGGSGATPATNVRVALSDQGVLTFTDANGYPVSPEVERAARKQAEADIERLIQEASAAANADIEALPKIHLLTPAPNPRPLLPAREFERVPPEPPTPLECSLLERLVPGRRDAIEAQNQARAQQHAVAMHAHQDAYREFLSKERRRAKRYTEAGKSGASAAYLEDFFEQIVGDLVWPRETVVEFQAYPYGRQIYLHVDLPEIEEFPDKEAVPQRGGVKFKPRSATAVRQTYAQHIHGIAFRLMGEVFAWLPGVSSVIFSGYSQRRDAGTGHVNDHYLISVRAERSDWRQLNFTQLDLIDPVEALVRFDLRRSMSKSGVFSSVTPFPP